MITDIGFQPGHLRRTRSGLPHHVVVAVAGGCGDQSRGVGHLPRIEVGPAAAGGADRDGVCGEHQPCLPAQRRRQGSGGLGDGVGEHRHQHRMVEVLPQLDQFGRACAGRGASARDVLLVLGASGVAAPGRGGEDRGPPDAVGLHLRDGVLDERFPVPIAEIHREGLSPLGDLGADLLDQRPVDRIDRRDSTKVVIVLGDRFEPCARDATAAGHVLQEGHHLLGTLRPAEGQQQQRVERWTHQINCVLAPPSA